MAMRCSRKNIVLTILLVASSCLWACSAGLSNNSSSNVTQVGDFTEINGDIAAMRDNTRPQADDGAVFDERKAFLDSITMTELSLPRSLTFLQGDASGGQAFLHALVATDKELLLCERAIIFCSPFPSLRGVFWYDGKTQVVREFVICPEKDVKVEDAAKWEDSLFFFGIVFERTDEKIEIIRHKQDFSPQVIIQLDLPDRLQIFPVLVELADDVLLVYPQLDASTSQLRILSLKSNEPELIYEADFSFAEDENITGRRILSIHDSQGDKVYAFLAVERETAILFVLNDGKMNEIKLSRTYHRVYTSGDKILLLREGRSSSTGSGTHFVTVFDLAEGSFSEETEWSESIKDCLGLGDGRFLFVTDLKAVNNRLQVVDTQENKIGVLKDFGVIGVVDSVVRGAADKVYIIAQDNGLEGRPQRIFVVNFAVAVEQK